MKGATLYLKTLKFIKAAALLIFSAIKRVVDGNGNRGHKRLLNGGRR
jgi:hypothetical protein